MRRRRLDPIRAIEASYAPVAGDGAWGRGILESLAALDLGMGLLLRTQRVGPDGEDGGTDTIATLDLDRGHEVLEGVRYGNGVASAAVFRELYAPHPPVSTAMGRLRGLSRDPSAREFQAMMRRLGMEDCLGVVATDVDGRGRTFLHVGVPIPSALALPPRTRHQLGRVAAHLASAWRLRRTSGPGAHPAEAVLESSGKLAHAEGDARERGARDSLVRAVARVERARGGLRRTDPDEALALWQGLVDGRWSLVDSVEADGRRFILARRNEPRVRDPKALTERERQVLAYVAMGHTNKYVAYQLGLSTPTVATHLEGARRKLGARSRLELIEMFAPAAPPPTRG